MANFDDRLVHCSVLDLKIHYSVIKTDNEEGISFRCLTIDLHYARAHSEKIDKLGFYMN